MMEINWIEYTTPIVTVVLAIAKIIYHALSRLSDYLEIKLGAENYKNAIEVAKGLYISLEDKYASSVKKMGEKKKQEMKELLLERFPELTDVELEAINKSVWSAFNQSWNEEVNANK